MNYSNFNLTDDHSLNIALALDYCKKNGVTELTFPKDTYVLKPQRASERALSISNHTTHNFVSIAMLIEDMENFTVDGGGSTFVCDGVMITAAILRSKNITLKNMTLYVKEHMRAEATVTAVGEGYFDFEVTNDTEYYINNDGMLCFKNSYGQDDPYHYYIIVCRENDEKGYIPETVESFKKDITFEKLGERSMRLNNPLYMPEVGMRIILAPRTRYGTTIFAENSKNTAFENVTVHTSYGMGIMAQLCENVSIDRLAVSQKDGALHSTNNDATHFVHCTGTVKVTNSFFEGMLDDALNAHGLYNMVERVDEKGILVRDMHPGSKGIDIYNVGCHIAVMDQRLLIPIKTYTIADTLMINSEYFYLTLSEGTDGIKVGHVCEELEHTPDIIFEGNTVQNNRARGMLLAAHGKTVVRNNYFHTPGISVMFESSGDFWFEAGNTEDVLIENNVFDNCGYATGAWGKGIIEVKKRKDFDGENYYHKSITVVNNEFKDNARPMLIACNVENITFKGNTTNNIVSPNEFINCKNVVEEL